MTQWKLFLWYISKGGNFKRHLTKYNHYNMNPSSKQGSKPLECTAPADHLLKWLFPYAITQQGKMTPAEKVTMSLYRSINQTSASRLVSKVAEESPLDPTLEADQPPRKPSVGKPDAGLEDGKPTEPASNGSAPIWMPTEKNLPLH